jgi:hypothetical protein
MKKKVIKVIAAKSKMHRHPQKEPDSFCRVVEPIFRNLIDLYIINEEHKRHFGSSWFNVGDLQFDKNPLNTNISSFPEAFKNHISENYTGTSFPEFQDLCARDPHGLISIGLKHLLALDINDEKCIETMFGEIHVWNMLSHYAPMDELFYKYTTLLVFRTGEVIGMYRAVKIQTIKMSEERQRRPRGRGDNTRLIIMEEADKVGIKTSSFGQKEREAKRAFIDNVNRRLPVALDSQHILSVLRKGLAERKR